MFSAERVRRVFIWSRGGVVERDSPPDSRHEILWMKIHEDENRKWRAQQRQRLAEQSLVAMLGNPALVPMAFKEAEGRKIVKLEAVYADWAVATADALLARLHPDNGEQ
jgi:hypothetical protein